MLLLGCYGCDTTALKDLVSSCYCWSRSFWSKSFFNGDSWDFFLPAGGSGWKEDGVQEMAVKDIHEQNEESFC